MKINLRDILNREAPELHAALLRSWDIAEDWFPTLNMDSESYGSKPHFLNVEHWLTEIACQTSEQWNRTGTELPFGLNAAELYILLSSVLFHDIGRGICSRNHGMHSRKLLEKNWQNLGIFSERMAREIGYISEFHTRDPQIWGWYTTTNIEPYGVIRTEALAALLCLADELDTSSERAIPRYMHPDNDYRFSSESTISLDGLLRDEKNFQTKGGYRDMIDQVDLHPASGYIATVLSHGALPEISDTESVCIQSWAEFYTRNKICFGDFSIEEAFFSYLNFFQHYNEESGKQVLGESFSQASSNARIASDFLARQFYNITSEFKHLDFFNKLRQPSKEIDIVNLLENTIYWERKNKIINRSGIETYRHGIDDLDNLHGFVVQSVKQIFDSKPDCQAEQTDSCYDFPKSRASSGSGCILGETGWELINIFSDAVYRELRTNLSKGKLSQNTSPFVTDLLSFIEKYRWSGNPAEPQDTLNAIIMLFTLLCFSRVKCILARIDCRTIGNAGELIIELRDTLENTISSGGIFDHSIIEQPQKYQENVLIAFYLMTVIFRIYRHCPIANIGIAEETQEKLNSIGLILARELCSDFEKRIKEAGQSDILKDARNIVFQSVKKRWENKYFGNARINREDMMFARRFLFMVWLGNDIRKKQKLIDILSPRLKKLNITFSKWLISYSGILFDLDWNICHSPDISYRRLHEIFDTVVKYKNELAVCEKDVRGAWEYLAVKLHIYRMEHLLFAEKQLANLIYIIKFAFDDSFDLKTLKKLHLEDFIRASYYKKRSCSSAEQKDLLFIEGIFWRLVNYKGNTAEADRILRFLKQLADVEDAAELDKEKDKD